MTVAALLSTTTMVRAQSKEQLDSISILLEKISILDQQYRLKWQDVISTNGLQSTEFAALAQKTRAQDSLNIHTVCNIIDEYGWLGPKQISISANKALFFVIQHAQLSVQLKYLNILRKAVKNGKARFSEYALLIDRTNMYQGKFQIYGSQLNYGANNELHIYPIKNEPEVDRRRKKMGLLPMRDYIKMFTQKEEYILPQSDRYKGNRVIKGSVTDKEKGSVIKGATISADNVEASLTDENGYYEVRIPKGTTPGYISISASGFHPLKLPFKGGKVDVETLDVGLTIK